jgi:hypothetical protein
VNGSKLAAEIALRPQAKQATLFMLMFILAGLLIDIDRVEGPSRVQGMCWWEQLR